MRREKRESLGSRRKSGWGMDLYRNRSEGWIGGVCSGLADHWGVATWMVRLAAIALLIFTGSLAFWGYIAAWEELTKNFNDNGVDPEYVVVATGSGGTQAGLLVGAQMQKAKSKIVAFNVCDDSNYFQNKIKTDVSLWKQRYKTEFDETALNIKTFEGYMGPAYGEAEEIVFQTIANLAKVEGVFLDPVYTGKAFHGMVSELSLGDRGRLQGAKNIVFIHTGGLFGVFPQHKNFQFD